MRIGILTLYYDNSNYGGLLQAYALQKCIADMDASSELISYNIQSGYSKHYSDSNSGGGDIQATG